MPTVETIRHMMQVAAEIERGQLREIRVEELRVDRKVHFSVSGAAGAFSCGQSVFECSQGPCE